LLESASTIEPTSRNFVRHIVHKALLDAKDIAA